MAQPSFKTLETMADALNVAAKDFLDFKGPILFRSQKEEVRQKRTYMDAISSEPEGMEVRELMAGHNVVKRLSGKTTC